MSTDNFGGGASFEAIQIAQSTQEPTQVPEPGALALFSLGLVGLAAAKRRKIA